MSDLLLTPDEMLEPIWEMGLRLEKEGKEPTQTERFKAIAKAQHDKILRKLKQVESGMPSLIVRLSRLQSLIARMEEADKCSPTY